jgi:hypothetical protein
MSYTKMDMTKGVIPEKYAGYPVPPEACEVIVEREEVSMPSMTDGSYLSKYPTGAITVKFLDGAGDMLVSFGVDSEGQYIPSTVTIPHKPSYRYSSTPPPPSVAPKRRVAKPPASLLRPSEKIVLETWNEDYYRYVLESKDLNVKFDHIILIHRDAVENIKDTLDIRDVLHSQEYLFTHPNHERGRTKITEQAYMDVISGNTTLDIIYRGGYDDFKTSIGL